MTKRIFLLFLCWSTFISLFPQELNHFPVKSGIIKYEMKGSTNGSQIIYFDDYGELVYESNSKILNLEGKEINETLVKIIKHDSIFEMHSKNKTTRVKYANIRTNQESQLLVSNDLINAMDYKKTGNENIAGVHCIEYAGENGKL